MHIFIVYTHPSEDSFTRHVRDEFIRGLLTAGHTYEISDLYKMNFQTDMSEAEYLRESYYNDKLPLSEDVIAEQEKINRCDVIVFIYPVFWTEAPAKLVGWFDRVWTYGFAYGERKMKKLKKAIFLVIAGHTIEHLKEYGHYDAMKTVMLDDRIFDRAESKEMLILDGTTKFNPELRQANWEKHLKTAFDVGKNL
jgi:NAD(P)H dehydrogenase (quinone)